MEKILTPSPISVPLSAPTINPEILSRGYILEPKTTRHESQTSTTPGVSPVPQIVGTIPNGAAFSAGPDVKRNGFFIKDYGRDSCVLPTHIGTAAVGPLLPTIQGMVDRFYTTRDAHRESFLLRISRHTAQAGEAHQSHIPNWHTHSQWGDSAYLLAADVLGTRFRSAGRETTAPDRSIVEFHQNDLHATPIADQETRRTLIILVSMGRDAHLKMTRRNSQDYMNSADLILGRLPTHGEETLAIKNAWRTAAITQLAATPNYHLNFYPLGQEKSVFDVPNAPQAAVNGGTTRQATL